MQWRFVLAMLLTSATYLATFGRADDSSPDKFNSDEITSIDPELARKLVRNAKGNFLSLNSVTDLNAPTAEVLAQNTGGLSLQGVQKIDDAVAVHLSQCKGQLKLSGIKLLSEKQAATLSQLKNFLIMEGLRELSSPELAKKFASQGSAINLPYITTLANPIADILSEAKSDVNLEGIEELDHAGITRKLADSNQPLHFQRLRKLTPTAAQGFRNSKCALYFPLLTELAAGASGGFEGHDGPLVFPLVNDVSEDDLRVILKNKGAVGLGSLRALAPPGKDVADDVLKLLGDHQGNLDLGLQDISVPVARALRRHKQHSHMPNVKAIDRNAAKELVGCKGVIWLTGYACAAIGADKIIQLLLTHKGPKDTGFVLCALEREEMKFALMRACEDHPNVYFGNLLD